MDFPLLGWPGRKRPSNDLVGLELDEDNLKICHVRVSSIKREVVRLVAHEVRDKSDDEILGLIRKTVTDFKIARPRAFLCASPHPIITRSIEVPSRDPDEIREIVSLQASRHTPYSRSEIIVDTLLLGSARENYTQVMIVIIPRETIVRQSLLLERAGLRLEKVLFPPEALCQAVAKILGAESHDGSIAIVHMDGWFTSFLVSRKGRIHFLRGIGIGANHLLDESQTYHDRFVDELQRSLETYLADEVGPPPSMLLLTGVAAETSALDELFHETLKIPIKHQTYFNYFATSKQARETADTSKRVSFFSTAAPLLLFDKVRADLVSEETKLRRALEQRAREAMTAAVLVMVLVALTLAAAGSKLHFKNAYLERVRARYAPVRKEAAALESAHVRLRTIRDFLSQRGASMEVLSELYDALPADVKVAEVKYDEGSRFTVKGTSRAMSSIFAFVTNLEKSERFKTVKTKHVTTRNEAGEDWADFEINALVEPGKGQE